MEILTGLCAQQENKIDLLICVSSEFVGEAGLSSSSDELKAKTNVGILIICSMVSYAFHFSLGSLAIHCFYRFMNINSHAGALANIVFVFKHVDFKRFSLIFCFFFFQFQGKQQKCLESYVHNYLEKVKILHSPEKQDIFCCGLLS